MRSEFETPSVQNQKHGRGQPFAEDTVPRPNENGELVKGDEDCGDEGEDEDVAETSTESDC
uniref:Uncharacterized protein n=1 Tax=Physcomitrium patens TaxID=3218 RepID=A0A2K1J320_PHYPA|nr:hypothetical protein PHYPA_021775 [Physcomitrium patens]